MDQYGGGSWMMVPNQSPMAQDHHSLQPQFHQPPPQPPPPPPPPQQQQQHHHHQSLASHFHLRQLVESLADVIESGNRDQHSDALITELTNHFDKCQQLLNSISESLSTKAMTVEGQKRKLEETVQQLNQRRDLISKYRNCVEEIVNSDTSR